MILTGETQKSGLEVQVWYTAQQEGQSDRDGAWKDDWTMPQHLPPTWSVTAVVRSRKPSGTHKNAPFCRFKTLFSKTLAKDLFSMLHWKSGGRGCNRMKCTHTDKWEIRRPAQKDSECRKGSVEWLSPLCSENKDANPTDCDLPGTTRVRPALGTF